MKARIVCDHCGSTEGSDRFIERVSREMEEPLETIHEWLLDGTINLEGAHVEPVE
jgi:hypothetical protein